MVIKIGKLKLEWIDILIIIFAVLVIYMLLTILFGESATPIEVTMGLFGFLGGLFYKLTKDLTSSINKLNREFGEFRIRVVNSFDNLKKDIFGLKKDIAQIKKK